MRENPMLRIAGLFKQRFQHMKQKKMLINKIREKCA